MHRNSNRMPGQARQVGIGRRTGTTTPVVSAERQGFEPWDPVSQVNSLAVSPIRPLSHLSWHFLDHSWTKLVGSPCGFQATVW